MLHLIKLFQYHKFTEFLNPNKTGLFEGSFFLEVESVSIITNLIPI